MKITTLGNKNAVVIDNGDSINLFSYNSHVAKVVDGHLTLGRDWKYSNTTLRHLYKFFELYCPAIEWDVFVRSNKKSYVMRLIDDGVIEVDETMGDGVANCS